jgi:hypothetical protein
MGVITASMKHCFALVLRIVLFTKNENQLITDDLPLEFTAKKVFLSSVDSRIFLSLY